MSSHGSIIDCDVHAEGASPEDLLPHLPEEWHDRYRRSGAPGASDAASEPGAVQLLQDQLIDPLGVERVVLSHGAYVHAPNDADPYYAAAVARAANDWLADHWLAEGSAFYGSILVSNQLPELAAEEIHRAAANPRMVQVLMADNAVRHPWGHTLFHPIFEAATELGLPVAIQAGGAGGMNPVPVGGGLPSLDIEYETLAFQGAMSALVSFVSEGVFEKFPGIRLVLLETGVAWLPSLIWRFDADFKGVRREVPWAKRLPSEYLREHVRFTTQPFDFAPGSEHVVELLEEMHADETLMFASDHPRSGARSAVEVLDQLPAEWLPSVLYGNALSTFRWPDRDAGGTGGALRSGAA